VTARLSVQLYSLREEAKQQGLAAVIERLGRAGCAGVEPAGLHGMMPEEFSRCVADAGMVVSSGHLAMPEPAQFNEVLDLQAAIGNGALVVAFLPPDHFGDADALARTADRLNAFNAVVRARGATLGYHNHWWEFTSRIGGASAHSHLFGLLDDDVFVELDTYWTKVGGADPVAVTRDYGARARLLHIKDGPADKPESDMTAVGEGTIDVAGIAAASQAAWHVVELDRCATDMFEAIEKSCRFLQARGFAQGRG